MVDVLAKVSDEVALRALSAGRPSLQHIILGVVRKYASDEGVFAP